MIEENILDTSEPEYMFKNGFVAGLAYDNNIILHPDYLSSNAAVHEYTHLWDAYTQKTNPKLWNKGLEIFKDTKYWNEVISDPNYQDIKDDENLVLSEIHSRICGDIAEKVLNRIAELDGEQVKLDAIDWDKEVSEYLYETFFITEKTEFFDRKKNKKIGDYESLRDFLSTPMKDLMESKNIMIKEEIEQEKNADSYTNQILDKIKAAGIEVVTDKDEFDRILEQEERLQKMAVSLSELENLNSTINNQTKNIQDEEKKFNTLAKKEKMLNEFSLNKFAEDITKYEKFFPNNEYIKIANLEYEKKPYKNFELYIGKNIFGHFVLSFTNENSITKEYSEHHDFYDIKNQRFQVYKSVTKFLLNEMNDVLEISKGLFAKKDYIPEIQDSLKNLLESIQSRQSDVLSQLIKNNEFKKQYLDHKVIQIKELEKIQARKTVDSWLYEAEEKAEDLWNKEQDDVKEYYKNTDERKSIGIIPQSVMQIFNGVEDYHLYSDKSVLIHHYLNRHYDNRLYENIQNVLDNYSNIYYDNKQNSICFAKNYGTLSDCLFVRNENGRVVLFASTYNQPEHRLHSERYKKITPAKKQEFKMSLEGSTPLSQNPEGNTAAAISDVNDNSIIADTENKSTIQKMAKNNNQEIDSFVIDKAGFVNPEKIAAIDLYGFEKAKEMWKNGEPDWETRMMLQDKSISDYLNWKTPNIHKKQLEDSVYGFVYNGKIYLNPEIMNSNAAVHEYTHLWDAYTQKTNPELWNKGLEIFKDTKYWNEVISDPNYQDIKDDENLVLSEIHSRICGDIAEKVLNRIAELDGEQVKLDAIDWDRETWTYIKENFDNSVSLTDSGIVWDDVVSFLSTPMKDLIASKNINISKIEGGHRKGFIESLNSIKENYLSNQVNYPPLKVYTFSPFGYEGTVVQVETDIRQGIPAFDIVGIADSAVKETRERIRAAFTNSGLDFPTERVLQSLSPADLRKDSPMDLSMALGILGQTKQYPVNESVLALGELELSGRIRPVRCLFFPGLP